MARNLVVAILVGLLGQIVPTQASAQLDTSTGADHDAASATDPLSSGKTTQQELNEILQELRKISALLEKQQAQPRGSTTNQPIVSAKIEMQVGTDWHVMGNVSAPVTVVEFTDLQCPFCRQFENNTFPKLKTSYIDTGKVKFISLDLPLPMHPYALPAAEAVQCAGDQGKFWELRTALFARADPPTKDATLESARSLGIGLAQFEECLDADKYKTKVEAEARDAAAIHVRGTPTFVIGRVADGRLTGVQLFGAYDYSHFQTEIELLLHDQK